MAQSPKEIRTQMDTWLAACPSANKTAVMLNAQSNNFGRQLEIYAKPRIGAQFLAIYGLDARTQKMVRDAAPKVDKLLLVAGFTSEQ